MDNHSKEEDTLKSPDLFAIYENLNEGFVDLTFKNLATSQAPLAKSNKKQHAKLIQKPSFDFSNGLAALDNPPPLTPLVEHNQEGKLNEEAVKPNGNLDHYSKEISAKQEINLNEEAKLNGNLNDSRGISPKQESKKLIEVKGDKEIKKNRGMRSPSARQIGEKENGLRSLIKRDLSLNECASKTKSSSTLMGDVLGARIKSPSYVKHGAHAHGGNRKLVAPNDMIMLMRTPPPSTPARFTHCTICSKFTFFFRIRCLDCKKWFCSKCAKRCVNEGKKCKGCSLEHSNCRRSNEKQAVAFYRKKEIAELTSPKLQKQSVVQKLSSKQLAKVKGARVMNSRPKDSPWTPPLSPRVSPRRHSNYAPTTSKFACTPPLSPRRTSFYRS